MARAKKLAKVAGLTGMLTANPYYNRPGQEGQYQHFRAIAEAVELPMLLYNIPSRTGVNLEPATVLRLAEIPNIMGVKESSGNMAQITELITQAPQRLQGALGRRRADAAGDCAGRRGAGLGGVECDSRADGADGGRGAGGRLGDGARRSTASTSG